MISLKQEEANTQFDHFHGPRGRQKRGDHSDQQTALMHDAHREPVLSALQNYTCAAQPRGVLPHIEGHGQLYRIHDERIRAEFTIANRISPSRVYTMPAELIVDSGTCISHPPPKQGHSNIVCQCQT
jgi:hypothetical protein